MPCEEDGVSLLEACGLAYSQHQSPHVSEAMWNQLAQVELQFDDRHMSSPVGDQQTAQLSTVQITKL